jgi:hypothetical protein
VSPRTFTLCHLFIRLKYTSQYLCIHHPQGTRILIWFKCIWLRFLMCPFMVSWQILQHIKNVIYNILFFYRQMYEPNISLFHLAYYVSFKVSFTSPNLLLWILGDVDLILCLLHITMLWYYYTYQHKLCSVQSLSPVLFNSKVVLGTITLARGLRFSQWSCWSLESFWMW